MHANIDTEVIGVERCVSCGAPLSGPYCARCGERALEPEALTLRHFLVHTVAHELLHVDGALWRTLRLLFVRPGRLSLEYAAGRRRPYVNPFRLLLIAIVAYALMTASGLIVTLTLGPVTMSLAPAAVRRSLSVETTIEQVDRYGLLRTQFAAKKERLTGDAARERFHDRLAAFAQPVSFANVLLLAVTLHLVFRWRRRRFLEHAAFERDAADRRSFELLAGRIRVPGHEPYRTVAVRLPGGRDPPVLSGGRPMGRAAAVGRHGDAHLRPQRALHGRGAGRRGGRGARAGVKPFGFNSS
jgi:hypothetical protein